MTSWASPSTSPTSQAPAGELTVVLPTGQDRLRAVTSAVRPDAPGSYLEVLYTYLAGELTSVLHAINVRTFPTLPRSASRPAADRTVANERVDYRRRRS